MAACVALAEDASSDEENEADFHQSPIGSSNAGVFGLRHGASETTSRSSLRLSHTAAVPTNGGRLQHSLSQQRKLKDLESMRLDHNAKAAAADDAQNEYDEEEQKLRTMRKRGATLRDPLQLLRQEHEVDRARERFYDAERSRDAVELSLHRLANEGAKAAESARQHALHVASEARERHAKEVRSAKRAISLDRAAEAAAREKADADAVEAARFAAEAKKHRSKSVQRLQATHTQHKARLEEAEQLREVKFQHDAQRLVGLKGSLDRINKQIGTTNELKQKKQHKLSREREERKEEVLGQGLNPYEVFRREDMEAERFKEKEKVAALAKSRQDAVREQLKEEDKRYQKAKEEETKRKVLAEEALKKTGNVGQSEKAAAYIRKMSIGNKEVLDPTGKMVHLDASKVTVHKSSAFGLGRARPEEIEKVGRDVRAASVKLAKSRPPRPTTGELDGSKRLDSASRSRDDGTTSSSAPPPRRPLPVVSSECLRWQEEQLQLQQGVAGSASAQDLGGSGGGAAFLAEPSEIAFNDFEVGKRYKQVVRVTNVSLTMKFNQFKLLDIDDRFKDFFEIDFKPPGRMSAGVTTSLTVWFAPMVNSDIKTTLPIQAMTGRIDFPLVCRTMKTELVFSSSSTSNPRRGPPGGSNVDCCFGQVLFGESEICVLSITNSGALPAQFKLESTDPNNEMLPMLTVEPSEGEFKARTTSKIEFRFRPQAMGSYAAIFVLSHGPLGGKCFPEEQHIQVRGECIDVPIHVDHGTYDMKTCIFGHTFRESIIVNNRQSAAMEIQIDQPKQIPDELHVNPRKAFLRGGESQAIQVKFSPKKDFLDRYTKFRDSSRPGLEGAFCIPVRIIGADQELPAETAIVGTLTTDRISFEPRALVFGRCFVGSSVAVRLTVTNESSLPQRYAFLRLPASLSIQDIPLDVVEEEQANAYTTGIAVLEGGGDGSLGSLLPKERRQLCITYAPDVATEMNMKVVFKTIAGSVCARESFIACRGQGVSPMLTLSHSQLDLAAAPCGTHSNESVVIKNTSRTSYMMNLLLPPPEISALQASPVCSILKPGESRRIQVTFKPTEEYINLLQDPAQQHPDDTEGEGNAATAAQSSPRSVATAAQDGQPPPVVPDPEELRQQRLSDIRAHGGRRWEAETIGSVHAAWRLALCVRPEAASEGSTINVSGATETMFYVGVGTCALRRSLVAEPVVLDFGEVAAQQRSVLDLLLRDMAGSDPQDLQIDPLPSSQCFTVLSAPRTIGGDQPLKLTVEFHPQHVQKYRTELQLRTPTAKVLVPLLGKGVSPVLQIEPHDGIVHLDSVIHSKDSRDYTSAQVLVRNDSDVPLSYNLETVVPADTNHSGVPPFTLAPSKGTVEPQGEQLVIVTFRPHRPMALFREKVLVSVPNQGKPTYLYLYGHCFQYQAYAIPSIVFGGDFDVATEVAPSSAFADSLAVGCGSNAGSDGQIVHQRVQQSEFLLQFEQGVEPPPLHLLVGLSVPKGSPLAPQAMPAATYRFEIIPSEFSSYFSIEPEGGKADIKAEGALVPGTAVKQQPAEAKPDKQVKIFFRYSPPKEANLTVGGVDLSLLGGIGQWITVKVQGSLRGGYVPPSEPPGASQEIVVTLRAYLQQI